jgi:outer membrane protein
MKKLLSIILFCSTLFSTAFAETSEEVTEVYTDTGAPTTEQNKPSNVHGILGAALFGTHKIIGDGNTVIGLFPLILMRYKDVAYWNIGGGGVWLLGTEDRSLRFGAGIRARGGWQPGDDAELIGMERRKGSLDGYLNGVWRTPLATLGAHYYHDIGHVSGSDAASLRLSHNFRIDDGLRLTPSIGATWQDSKRVDYYYGVRPLEALPLRPAYMGHNAINVNAGLAGSYLLPHSWSLLGGVITTRFGSGIVDSPIVTRRYSTLVYFGAGWRF